MACGVRGHDLIVRVAADAAEAALREPGTRPFDLTGRPMKGWLLVDADGHAEDDDLRRWSTGASPTPPRYRPSNRASYQHAERKPAATARPAGHSKAASHKGVTQDPRKYAHPRSWSSTASGGRP
jgi:hypothetical protein